LETTIKLGPRGLARTPACGRQGLICPGRISPLLTYNLRVEIGTNESE
jgi:hypothetical protein